MKRARIFFLSFMSISTLVLVVAAYLLRPEPSATDANTAYQGTNLGSVPAPDFSLVDQTGTTISLHQWHGHPVVLTFLYTHCPGPCPLLAEKLRVAAEQLGAQADQVVWLAVSLDAKGDTQASATAFVETHRLDGSLVLLAGHPYAIGTDLEGLRHWRTTTRANAVSEWVTHAYFRPLHP